MLFDSAILPENAATASNISLRVGAPIITKSGNNLEFDTCFRRLKPFEECTIRVSVNCITEETINEYIEVMVRDSDSVFF